MIHETKHHIVPISNATATHLNEKAEHFYCGGAAIQPGCVWFKGRARLVMGIPNQLGGDSLFCLVGWVRLALRPTLADPLSGYRGVKFWFCFFVSHLAKLLKPITEDNFYFPAENPLQAA